MLVRRWVKALPHKVANVAHDDKDEITYICRQQNIIWRILVLMAETVTGDVFRGGPVVFVRAVPKFRMDSREHLLRRRGTRRNGQPVTVIDFGLIQDGILGRLGNGG